MRHAISCALVLLLALGPVGGAASADERPVRGTLLSLRACTFRLPGAGEMPFQLLRIDRDGRAELLRYAGENPFVPASLVWSGTLLKPQLLPLVQAEGLAGRTASANSYRLPGLEGRTVPMQLGLPSARGPRWVAMNGGSGTQAPPQLTKLCGLVRDVHRNLRNRTKPPAPKRGRLNANRLCVLTERLTSKLVKRRVLMLLDDPGEVWVVRRLSGGRSVSRGRLSRADRLGLSKTLVDELRLLRMPSGHLNLYDLKTAIHLRVGRVSWSSNADSKRRGITATTEERDRFDNALARIRASIQKTKLRPARVRDWDELRKAYREVLDD